MILDAYTQEIEQLRKKINQFLEKIISNTNRELFSKIYSHFNIFNLQEIKKVTQANFHQLIQILKTIIKLSSKVSSILPFHIYKENFIILIIRAMLATRKSSWIQSFI